MNILVTGGAGYIGSHVVRRLSEAGHGVVVFDNLSTGFAESLLYGEKLIVGDLSDSDLIDDVIRNNRIDTVLHFAASIVAPQSVTEPLKYYANNTRNTLNLITACAVNNVERFVFSSTAAVYGYPEGGYASEGTQLSPLNPYGTSKLMSEWMLRDTAAAHSSLRYVILRYFNVAGADTQSRIGQRTPEATHLIKLACQTALGIRKELSIYGTDYPTPDGTGVRDYIHVEDLSSAHVAALDYLVSGGASEIVNVGYGSGKSVREVVSVAKKVSGVDFRVVESPRRPGDPAMLVSLTEKIRGLFNWSPEFDNLETIVENAWRWEQKLFSRT